MKDEINRRVEVVYGGLNLQQLLKVAAVIVFIAFLVVMAPIIIVSIL